MKHLQNSIFTLTVILFFGFFELSFAQKNQPVDHVDPFIGTDFFGHMYPGAALPNALVHLSPDIHTEGWTYCAGYIYQDSSIMGFSHTHWSGVGMVNGGEILLMPTTGDKLQIVPGTKEDPDSGYRSRFDHAEESASPGYYSVLLKDYNIKAELTSTKRAGFHRYTFPKGNNSRIILDVGHQIGDMSQGDVSEFKIIDNNRIEGTKGAGLGKVYFVAEFNKPFTYYGTYDASYKTPESDGSVFPYKNAERGDKIGAFVQFHTNENEQVLVKVGISYTSVEGARNNLHSEIPDWDFDKVRIDARNIWNKELSKITIDGAREDQKEIFTTALYHSLLAQYISQDVDGKYFGSDGKVHIAKDFDFYGSFSCWDTYRSQHPLLTLIAPEHVNDYVRSIQAKVENYGWLPAQHFLNVYGEAMVGDHLIPIIVDAYKKGYRDYDVKLLYNAMRKKALEYPKAPIPHEMGRSGLKYYKKVGYAPIDKVTEAVPNTLELAYDDWCIAQFAKEIGEMEDYNYFLKRSENWRNVYDSKSTFMRPKNKSGTFLKDFIPKEYTPYFCESNAWQYFWYVPQNVEGLIKEVGGSEPFEKKLDSMFSFYPLPEDKLPIFSTGMIGQYAHGNEPSHHVGYLYNYLNKPWKTQEIIREILDTQYKNSPDGHCGNEDCGQMSSWYIFSSLGFYPVNPAQGVYSFGSPIFDKATIHLENGKEFRIQTINNSKENKYIQSIQLNGNEIHRNSILHSEIMEGGDLIFQMGKIPNKNLIIDEDHLFLSSKVYK